MIETLTGIYFIGMIIFSIILLFNDEDGSSYLFIPVWPLIYFVYVINRLKELLK